LYPTRFNYDHCSNTPFVPARLQPTATTGLARTPSQEAPSLQHDTRPVSAPAAAAIGHSGSLRGECSAAVSHRGKGQGPRRRRQRQRQVKLSCHLKQAHHFKLDSTVSHLADLLVAVRVFSLLDSSSHSNDLPPYYPGYGLPPAYPGYPPVPGYGAPPFPPPFRE
jgi:hypothetical protein